MEINGTDLDTECSTVVYSNGVFMFDCSTEGAPKMVSINVRDDRFYDAMVWAVNSGKLAKGE